MEKVVCLESWIQATEAYVSMNIKHMNIKQKVLCSYFNVEHQLVENLVYGEISQLIFDGLMP